MKSSLLTLFFLTLLSAGSAVANVDDDLLRATEKGDLANVKLLLSKGANVNAKDRLGVSALMFAVINDDPEISDLLISAGADVNGADIVGSNPLTLASELGAQVDILKMLISAGANINAKDNSGWTPLLLASKGQHRDLVEFLLQSGADKNSVTDSGVTFALSTAEGGLFDIVVDLVAKGENINERSSDGFSVLMYAVWRGSADIVGRLIKLGAKVNARDSDGNSALAYAEANHKIKTMALLRKNGAVAAFGRGLKNVYCKQIRSSLSDFAIANENYFLENTLYIVSGDGSELFIWTAPHGAKLTLGGERSRYFTAEISHRRCVDEENKKAVFRWDSSRGGLQ